MTPEQIALADELSIAGHIRIENGRLLSPREKLAIIAALRVKTQDAVREDHWECSCGGDPNCPNPCRFIPGKG